MTKIIIDGYNLTIDRVVMVAKDNRAQKEDQRLGRKVRGKILSIIILS